jgi:NADH-quinone oxidoreductase subunit L
LPGKTYALANQLNLISTEITESHAIGMAGFSVLIALLGIGIAYTIYLMNAANIHEDHKGFRKILFHKYYIDEIYGYLFVKPFTTLSNGIGFVFDRYVIDHFFVGIGLGLRGLGGFLRRLQTGFVGDYALYISLGSFFIIIYLLVKGV